MRSLLKFILLIFANFVKTLSSTALLAIVALFYFIFYFNVCEHLYSSHFLNVEISDFKYNLFEIVQLSSTP